MMAATGLQPTEVDNAFRKGLSIKDREALWKYTEQRFIREYRRALAAADAKNPEQAKDYMNRAFAWTTSTGYPQEELPKLIARAADGRQNIISRTDWKFYLDKVPQDQKAKMYKAFEDQMAVKYSKENK
jgi:hypothetical protein